MREYTCSEATFNYQHVFGILGQCNAIIRQLQLPSVYIIFAKDGQGSKAD